MNWYTKTSTVSLHKGERLVYKIWLTGFLSQHIPHELMRYHISSLLIDLQKTECKLSYYDDASKQQLLCWCIINPYRTFLQEICLSGKKFAQFAVSHEDSYVYFSIPEPGKIRFFIDALCYDLSKYDTIHTITQRCKKTSKIEIPDRSKSKCFPASHSNVEINAKFC